jgi:hypothetical protein
MIEEVYGTDKRKASGQAPPDQGRGGGLLRAWLLASPSAAQTHQAWQARSSLRRAGPDEWIDRLDSGKHVSGGKNWLDELDNEQA